MFIGLFICYLILCVLLCFHIHSLGKSEKARYDKELNKYKSHNKEIKIGSVVRINNNDIIDSSIYTVKQMEHKDKSVYLILCDENSGKMIKTNLNNVVKLY